MEWEHCPSVTVDHLSEAHLTGSHDTDRAAASSLALTCEGGSGPAPLSSDHTLLFGRQELSVCPCEVVCDLRARGDGEVDACLERGRLDLGDR